MIKQEYLDRAMTYEEYCALLRHLMEVGKTTGDNQSETYLHYAKLNLQRMQRLDKTLILTDALINTIRAVEKPFTWLVLTEGWCGDAAQSLPVIAAIEKASPTLTLKLLLRDENLDLMDQYLTDSSRSIPKLICVNAPELKEIFTWGPRPWEVQTFMLDLKQKGTPKEEKATLIQKWYNADKTLSIQNEFNLLIKQFLN